jgi:hypothetical protein
MATPSATFDRLDSYAGAQSNVDRVPWFLYAVLFASTSVIVGVLWDISWHRTIGRDSFWTPAHLAIYLGGIVAGLTCGWIALTATFGATPAATIPAVRFWGFRAPLGAWVCIWGAFAMLTSAPFDDWWHNTYGLDVKILSPPHVLLAAGIGAIQCGAMLMALACQNRSTGRDSQLSRLFLLASGLLLILVVTMSSEDIQRWDMHRAFFYQVSAGAFPFFLVSAARASKARWAATTTALVYMGLTIAMILVLPLFSARPLLGPIFVQVDRFMPPDFPLLLCVPALLVDVLVRRMTGRDWRLSLVLAVAFVAASIAVQWPFADFLMSPWARNRFFISDRMPYSLDPVTQQRWYILNAPDNLRRGMPIAMLLAFVSARFGLWWGNWMSRVQR